MRKFLQTAASALQGARWEFPPGMVHSPAVEDRGSPPSADTARRTVGVHSYTMMTGPASPRLFATCVCASLLIVGGIALSSSWKGPPHTLVVALDGIPYDSMRAAQRDGLFADFHPVSRMVSAFPSMTDVAFAELFDAPAPDGYQRVYYSYIDKRVVGGRGRDLFGKEAYEHGFHSSRLTDFDGTMLYFSSKWLAARERSRMENMVLESTSTPVFFAFIRASDLIVHRYGEKGTRRFLETLNEDLVALRAAYADHYGRALDVIIVSDHGNTMMHGKRIRMKEELEERGFHLKKEIDDDHDVVAVVNGIVSYMPLYTRPHVTGDLARALVTIEGVDAAVFETPVAERRDDHDRVRVVTAAGEAVLVYDRERDRVRYEPVTGDALGYLPVWESARNRGLTHDDGSIAEDDFFDLTIDHPYPDAIRRGWACFNGSVDYPARVVASIAPGYEFASPVLKALSRVGNIWGTHGALGAVDSLGIYMRTDRPTEDINTWDFRHEVDLRAYHKQLRESSPPPLHAGQPPQPVSHE